MECISKAKHYIYIENQFFSKSYLSTVSNFCMLNVLIYMQVTATRADDKLIKNKIGQVLGEVETLLPISLLTSVLFCFYQAIVERIKRAHKEKKKFRVIVVIPSAPGFEGDFASQDKRSMSLR